jgi:hypothetical protein
MRTNLVKKICCGLTIGCLFLSLGGLALANNASDSDNVIHRPDSPPQADMPNPGHMEQHIKKSLEKLVNEGTITKDQADKVIQFFKEKDSQRKAEMDKVKDMSPEDRETYLKQKFNNRPDFINELQSATDLSEEQAKIVADALRPPHRPNSNCPICPMTPQP